LSAWWDIAGHDSDKLSRLMEMEDFFDVISNGENVFVAGRDNTKYRKRLFAPKCTVIRGNRCEGETPADSLVVVGSSLVGERFNNNIADLDVYLAKFIVRPRFTKYERPPGPPPAVVEPAERVIYSGGDIRGNEASFIGSVNSSGLRVSEGAELPVFEVVREGVGRLRANLAGESVPGYVLIGGGLEQRGGNCTSSWGTGGCTCAGAVKQTIDISEGKIVMCLVGG